jgi:hypothetical protein
MVGRQIGMILGPAINFALIQLNVNIGPYLLNNLSAPGFLMALAWTFLELLVLFFYQNLTDFRDEALNANSASARAALSNISDESEPLLSQPAPSNSLLSETGRDFEENESLANSDLEQLISVNQAPRYQSSVRSSTSFSFFKNRRRNNPPKVYDSIKIVDNSETVPLVVRIYDEYIQEEVVAVYATTFTVFFMQTCLEVKYSSF